MMKNNNLFNCIYFFFAFLYATNLSAQTVVNCLIIGNTFPIVTYDPNTCDFSIESKTSIVSNAFPCATDAGMCFMSPVCTGFCYSWKLFLDVGAGFSIVGGSSACTNSDTHTFSNLSTAGIYKVVVEYRHLEFCAVSNNWECAIYHDIGSINTNNFCNIITPIHNNNQPAAIKRAGLININCSLQNNKTTILLSETEIRLQPGFRSGTGSNTYFHAYIASCSSIPMRMSSGGINSNNPKNMNTNSSALVTNSISTENNLDKTLNSYQFAVIPNPNNGDFKITLNNNSELPKAIVVRDILGRVIINITNPTEYIHNLNIESSSNGIFIINVFYSENTVSKRIIKN